MMAPVQGYGSEDRGSLKKLKVEDQKKLLNYFDAAQAPLLTIPAG